MAGSHRRPTNRRRKLQTRFSDEVLDLFERGRQLQSEGYDSDGAPDDDKRAEFLSISKELDWSGKRKLSRYPHMTSLFDDYDDPEPPDYMKGHDGMEWDFNGYRGGRVLKQRLMEALAARGAHK
jgi:hypothetical protein